MSQDKSKYREEVIFRKLKTLVRIVTNLREAELAGRCEGCEVGENEVPDKLTPQEKYNLIQEHIKDTASDIYKVLEKPADCEGCREIISDKGSDRECGHFVREIMSYCPVCQEIASLQQQIKLEKWSI
jgi:hypothetical protein